MNRRIVTLVFKKNTPKPLILPAYLKSMHKLNILLVEDNDGDVFLQQMMLENINVINKIKVAQTLNAATHLLTEDHFDVVLLDLSLPDASELDGLIAIRDKNISTCIIVITGSKNKLLGKKAVEHGADDYLSKDNLNESILEKSIDFGITRRNFVKQLKESNDSKDKFFSILAHDLRGPLNSFIGLTEIISEDYNDIPKEKALSLLSNMYNSAKNVNKLLENLLEWSRLQVGNIKYKPETIQINRLVETNSDFFKESALIKNIKINVHCHKRITVVSDNNMLNTCLRNLLSNAIKFSNKNTEIDVFCELVDEKTYSIIVKDYGVGMPQKIKSNLFKLGERVNRIGTNKEASSGLGLVLVKELMYYLNGSIEIESEENLGTTVTLTLPINND